MATFYGNWVARDKYYKQRLILDVNRNGNTVSYRLSIQSTGSMRARVPWHYTGGISGSGESRANYSGGFTMVLNSGSISRTQSITISASARVHWGGNLSVSGSVGSATIIPERPTYLRFNRTSADRLNATGTVSWVPGERSTSTRVTATYTGGEGDVNWYTLGTSSDRTLHVHGLRPNGAYKFAAVASNSAGESSTAAETPWYYTKPSAPFNVTAIRTSSTEARINWSSNTYYGFGTQVESSAGESWNLGNGTSGPVSMTLNVGLSGSNTIRYRARNFVGSDSDRLYSEWSPWSGTVSPLSPPSKPTRLLPSGAVNRDLLKVPISWTHSSVDGTEQQAYQIRYKRDQYTSWKEIPSVASSDSSVVLSGSDWQLIRDTSQAEYQVRTKGEHPEWSPWSDSSILRPVSPPTVKVANTAKYLNYTSNQLSIKWKTLSSSSQTAWKVTVSNSDGDIQTFEGIGDTDTLSPDVVLEDQSTYQVDVLSQIEGSIWSDPVSFTVRTHFIKPNPPSLDSEFEPLQGAISLTVTKADQAVSIKIERSIDGGKTFVTLAEEDLTSSDKFSISDPECVINGNTLYRISNATALGVSSHILETVVTSPAPFAEGVADGKCAAYLSAGPTYTNPLVLPYKLSRQRTVGRSRSLVRYSGKPYPVVYVGESMTEELSLSGKIRVDANADGVATEQEFIDLANSGSATFLWRDPEGNHLYGTISDITLSRTSRNVTDWSLQLTRTHRGNDD